MVSAKRFSESVDDVISSAHDLTINRENAMTPIPDYKPTRNDERYEGARKVGEYITFAIVVFLLCMGLGSAALVGDELKTLRVAADQCGAVEQMGMGR
jgi:hypothetical protein